MMTELDIFIGWLYNPLPWLGIILIVAGNVFLTVFWRIRAISRLNPSEIIRSE